MTHHECRGMSVEALYAELESAARGRFDEHLRGCKDCSEEFSRLQALAATMNERERSEMTTTDWTIFWNELSSKLSEDAGRKANGVLDKVSMALRMRPALRYGLAAISLILVGVMIGKIAFTTSHDVEMRSLSQKLSDTEKILLNERAQSYLQRSKILLLGIINTSGVTPSSLLKEQEVSRSLIREASGLRGELTEADQQRMRKLVVDLEVILLQIANIERQKGYPGIEIVRDGVERSGLLLKINLEQMKAQDHKHAPVVHRSRQQDSGT